MKKSGFPKMHHYARFSQIRSHMFAKLQEVVEEDNISNLSNGGKARYKCIKDISLWIAFQM